MCRETPTPQSSPNRHISPPSPSNLPSSPQTFKYGPIPPPKSPPNSSNLQIIESLRLEKTSDIPNSNPLPPPLPASLLPHLCLSPTPCHHLAALSKQGFLTSHLQLPPPPRRRLWRSHSCYQGAEVGSGMFWCHPPPKCHRCFTRDCRHEIPVHEGFQVRESHGSPPLPAKGLPAISNSLLES